MGTESTISTLGWVPHRNICPCCWAQMSLLTPENPSGWTWTLWLGQLSLRLLTAGCCVAPVCTALAECIMHSSSLSVSPHPEKNLTCMVEPDLPALSTCKNVSEKGLSSFMEGSGLCLLPRLCSCGILLI